MTSRRTMAAAVGLLALNAAAPAWADAKPADAAKARNACFWTRNADGFAAVDEHTLNVRVGVRDVFQFEMFGSCQGMDWSNQIGLVSRSGDQICAGMDAEVITHSPGSGRQRCMVRSVRKLTAEEVAALPKRAKP